MCHSELDFEDMEFIKYGRFICLKKYTVGSQFGALLLERAFRKSKFYTVSSHGWELMIDVISEDYGFSHDEQIIFGLVPPFSVISENRSHKLPIILENDGAVILLLALAACFLRMRGLRGDKAHMSHNVSEALPQQEEIMILDLRALIIATKDFHNDNKLGKGGFGPVYKGGAGEMEK